MGFVVSSLKIRLVHDLSSKVAVFFIYLLPEKH